VLTLIHQFHYRKVLLSSLVLFLLTAIAVPPLSSALDWVPTDEEIKKYRQSWNPLSHGPILLQAVDVQPKGQLAIREFIFSQIGESSFGNQLSFASDAKNGPVHLYQVSPSVNASYGLTSHVELGAAISMNSFWATQNGQSTSSTGLGDTSLIMTSGARHRQDRKLLSPPFHGARMRAYEDTVREVVANDVATWPVNENRAMPRNHRYG